GGVVLLASRERAVDKNEFAAGADRPHPRDAAAQGAEIDRAAPLGPHDAAIDAAPGLVAVARNRPVIADGRRPRRLPRERREVHHAVPSTPSEGVLPPVGGRAPTGNESPTLAPGGPRT